MELLCIQTHKDKVVVAGQVYLFIKENRPCECDCVDVGIRHTQTAHFMTCKRCGYPVINDGIWWLHKSRFIPIGTQDELENYKLSEPSMK